MELLEKDFNENLTVEGAIQLGLKTLHAGTDGKLNAEALEIAVVTTDEAFRLLTADEVRSHVKAEKKE